MVGREARVRGEGMHVYKDRDNCYGLFCIPQLMARPASVGATHYAAPLV